MTGIERLRKLSGDLIPYRLWNVLDTGTEEDRDCHEGDYVTLSDVLRAIAGQIEREHAEDCFRMGERAAEDAEAVAWVREHGGLDRVKAEWSSRVPHDLYERRRRRLLGHIAECETALGRRNQRIEELGHRVGDLTSENAELRRRAMPEGMEWPRYDTGEPVRFGGDFLDHQDNVRSVLSVKMFKEGVFEIGTGQGTYDWHSAGERVRRPAPAVLAADGEPLEVGQTVWHTESGEQCTVLDIEFGSAVSVEFELTDAGCRHTGTISPSHLTHQRPVLDADGVPINVGDTVYEVGENYPPFVVGRLPEPGAYRSVRVVYPSGAYTFLDPERLTHTKPEPPDSWERIEEDARGLDSGVDRELFTHTHEDIVRRCKALVERGE